MNFCIAVHGAPYGSYAHQRALKLARSVLTCGHGITRIFFYHEAVTVALATAVAPQDEFDARRAWVDFHNETGVELSVCIANGVKRGVLSASEANRHEIQSHTLEAPFELVGLGQLIDGCLTAERYIEIPA